MAKKYRVMNPRKASCPSGRNLLILDGQKYSEGDEYEPPPDKEIDWLVDRGFLKEVGSDRGKGEAQRDVSSVQPPARRSRRMAEVEAPDVPAAEEVSV